MLETFITLDIQNLPESISIQHVHGVESLSSLFSFQLEIRTPRPLSCLLSPATLTFWQAQDKRVFTGVITNIVSLTHKPSSLYRQRIILKPRLWLADQQLKYRTWVNTNVEKIIQALLHSYQLNVSLSFTNKNKEIPLFTQYHQSDLAAMKSLLHQSSAFFVLNHDNESELYITDRPLSTKDQQTLRQQNIERSCVTQSRCITTVNDNLWHVPITQESSPSIPCPIRLQPLQLVKNAHQRTTHIRKNTHHIHSQCCTLHPGQLLENQVAEVVFHQATNVEHHGYHTPCRYQNKTRLTTLPLTQPRSSNNSQAGLHPILTSKQSSRFNPRQVHGQQRIQFNWPGHHSTLTSWIATRHAWAHHGFGQQSWFTSQQSGFCDYYHGQLQHPILQAVTTYQEKTNFVLSAP